jgi:hypothetical protein
MAISPPVQAPTPPPAPGEPHAGRFVRWHQRVLGFCFAIFALEVGLFLLMFPWLRSWDLNWVPMKLPSLRAFWMNPYFRGAISGLGLLNLYVGITEMGRQIRSLFS